MQNEFGFVSEVRSWKPVKWVRAAVMTFKPWKAGGWDGERSKGITLESWLMWHAPLGNGGAL